MYPKATILRKKRGLSYQLKIFCPYFLEQKTYKRIQERTAVKTVLGYLYCDRVAPPR